jgi:hypothetical protein
MRPTSSINLCSGVYQPAGGAIPSVEVLCQVLVVYGVSCAWIDGVDMAEPVMLPIEHLSSFKRMGTLVDYLADERHHSLSEGLVDVLALCETHDCSPTTMVRAIELMHAEGLSPENALSSSLQWGTLLLELDKADRLVH